MKLKYIRAAWFTAVITLLSLAIATEPASNRQVLSLQVGAVFIAVSMLGHPFVTMIRRPGGMRLGATGYCLVGFVSVLVAHLIPDGSEGIIVCAVGLALPSAFFFRPPPDAR